MIKWQKNGKKVLISVLLTAILVTGSSITALAASSQVMDGQRDWYQDTRDIDTIVDDTEGLEAYVIPADEIDEEKWETAIVFEEEVSPLVVQKYFNWTVPVGTFVRSTAFIKSKGTTIIVSCYVDSSIYHRVGIRRPDGSMLCVNGKGQVTKTFNCETTGTYYVFVENLGSTPLQVGGYYIR